MQNDRVTRFDALNTERTVFFSDAVIAIAMTLLAIELPLPHGDTSAELWHDFGHKFGTSYLSFIISFTVIAAFWYHHHRFFQHVDRVNTRLTIWNLLGLFAIVLIPFATKLLSGEELGLAEENHSANTVGPVIYASMMLLWGLSYILMVLAARRDGLWREGINPSTAANMIFGATSALAMFAISIPIAFADPQLAMLSWLLIPVISIGAGRLRRRLTATTAAK